MKIFSYKTFLFVVFVCLIFPQPVKALNLGDSCESIERPELGRGVCERATGAGDADCPAGQSPISKAACMMCEDGTVGCAPPEFLICCTLPPTPPDSGALPIGNECTSITDTSCGPTSYCGYNGTKHVCMIKKGSGVECEYSQECSSGTCNNDNDPMGPKRCVPAAMAPLPSIKPVKPVFCSMPPGAAGIGPGSPERVYISTVLGCILVNDPQFFVEKIISWLLPIAGALAFVFMLAAGFEVMTSSGNPEKLKAGQERLTSAIIGLLFVIFSIFILRLVGIPIMFISQ